MNLRLPPHIGWPLLIVGLLLISITASVGTFVIANADGGAQVVDDYYRQAVHWNETAARRAASAALGWEAAVTIRPEGTAAGLRGVDVLLRDRQGAPVTGLHGTVRALRPQRAGAVAAIPLAPVPDVPGLYRQQMPIDAAGLWDFEITAERDTSIFVTTVRIEVAGPAPDVE